MSCGCEYCGEVYTLPDDVGLYDGWYHKKCFIEEDKKMRPELYKNDVKK